MYAREPLPHKSLYAHQKESKQSLMWLFYEYFDYCWVIMIYLLLIESYSVILLVSFNHTSFQPSFLLVYCCILTIWSSFHWVSNKMIIVSTINVWLTVIALISFLHPLIFCNRWFSLGLWFPSKPQKYLKFYEWRRIIAGKCHCWLHLATLAQLFRVYGIK